MHHPLPSVSRSRRLSLRAALGTLLTLAAWNCQAADAAAGVPAAASGLPKAVHLVYVENDLREPGLTTSTERDPALVDYKYYEMGRYLQERAPMVFAANAVTGDVTILPPPASGEELKLDFPAGDSVVLMTAKSYSTRKKLFQTWANVVFGVNVLQPGAAGAPRRTRSATNAGIVMGPDPVLGVLRLNRLDPSFVDGVLVDLLNEMAAKGELTLPAAKAVRPLSAS